MVKGVNSVKSLLALSEISGQKINIKSRNKVAEMRDDKGIENRVADDIGETLTSNILTPQSGDKKKFPVEAGKFGSCVGEALTFDIPVPESGSGEDFSVRTGCPESVLDWIKSTKSPVLISALSNLGEKYIHESWEFPECKEMRYEVSKDEYIGLIKNPELKDIDISKWVICRMIFLVKRYFESKNMTDTDLADIAKISTEWIYNLSFDVGTEIIQEGNENNDVISKSIAIWKRIIDEDDFPHDSYIRKSKSLINVIENFLSYFFSDEFPFPGNIKSRVDVGGVIKTVIGSKTGERIGIKSKDFFVDAFSKNTINNVKFSEIIFRDCVSRIIENYPFLEHSDKRDFHAIIKLSAYEISEMLLYVASGFSYSENKKSAKQQKKKLSNVFSIWSEINKDATMTIESFIKKAGCRRANEDLLIRCVSENEFFCYEDFECLFDGCESHISEGRKIKNNAVKHFDYKDEDYFKIKKDMIKSVSECHDDFFFSAIDENKITDIINKFTCKIFTKINLGVLKEYSLSKYEIDIKPVVENEFMYGEDCEFNIKERIESVIKADDFGHSDILGLLLRCVIKNVIEGDYKKILTDKEINEIFSDEDKNLNKLCRLNVIRLELELECNNPVAVYTAFKSYWEREYFWAEISGLFYLKEMDIDKSIELFNELIDKYEVRTLKTLFFYKCLSDLYFIKRDLDKSLRFSEKVIYYIRDNEASDLRKTRKDDADLCQIIFSCLVRKEMIHAIHGFPEGVGGDVFEKLNKAYEKLEFLSHYYTSINLSDYRFHKVLLYIYSDYKVNGKGQNFSVVYNFIKESEDFCKKAFMNEILSVFYSLRKVPRLEEGFRKKFYEEIEAVEKNDQAYLYYRLGVSCDDLGFYDKAKNYYLTSKNMYESLADVSPESQRMKNMCRIIDRNIQKIEKVA